MLNRALQNKAVSLSRVVAIAIALIMTWYFLTTDAVRTDNPFLVPDLLFTLFLYVAAVLPVSMAKPALVHAFGWMCGVLMVSLFTYIVRGDFPDGANHIPMMVPCFVLAIVLGRDLYKSAREREPALADERASADHESAARARL